MTISKFDPNNFYHIYNRSIGKDLLFNNHLDYHYFISKMKRYILPYAKIYSYCLIPNHFHLLIRIKDAKDLPTGPHTITLDQAFKNFFNSYTRSYNISHKRIGRLFQQGYKCKLIDSENYLLWIIFYIHRNPIHHKLTQDCSTWEYSSYNDILHEKNYKISQHIFELYGSKNAFIEFTEELAKEYIVDDI
jgi:REP element-mobilizing transposase RayT